MGTNGGGEYSLDAFRHLALGEVTSTNSECLRAAREGDPGMLWITAERQTAGRGRRGRHWASEGGNLYASLLLLDPSDAALLSSLPLAVSVAVHATLKSVLPSTAEALEIKWPNDVLIGRKKACGILLEAEMLASGQRAVVAGIGINIRYRPEDAPYGVTSLSEQGVSQGADELFACLYREMAWALKLWDHGRGVAEVTRLWREAACGIGGLIRVNLPDRSLDGRFVGIDDQGLLILEAEGRQQLIAAGDVFLL
ncbi:biotin--[acetyl-CoA-carboxylase] ligase [Rhizobium helianthi]|uniref:biotin--[biotin carboxyl-carrier protein] ligase n=1 Tax=Rhizobium helianthi TaxID=1132695 RepID=A0ABW4M0S2_9HYPH